MRFMEDALRLDPAERLDWRRALAHPYFDGMDGWVPADEKKEARPTRPGAADAPSPPPRGNPFRLRAFRRVRRGDARGGTRDDRARGKSPAEAREEAARARAAETGRRRRRRRRRAATPRARARENAERLREEREAREARRRREAIDARARLLANGWSAMPVRRAEKRRLERETALELACATHSSLSLREQRRTRPRTQVARGERVSVFATRCSPAETLPESLLLLGTTRSPTRSAMRPVGHRETKRNTPESRRRGHRSRITGFGGFGVSGFDASAPTPSRRRRAETKTSRKAFRLFPRRSSRASPKRGPTKRGGGRAQVALSRAAAASDSDASWPSEVFGDECDARRARAATRVSPKKKPEDADEDSRARTTRKRWPFGGTNDSIGRFDRLGLGRYKAAHLRVTEETGGGRLGPGGFAFERRAFRAVAPPLGPAASRPARRRPPLRVEVGGASRAAVRGEGRFVRSRGTEPVGREQGAGSGNRSRPYRRGSRGGAERDAPPKRT